MKQEIELLNREISECLRTAWIKVENEKACEIESELSKYQSSADFVMKYPVRTPCNLLMTVAKELGISNQLSKIYFSYQLRVALNYLNGRNL